MDDSRRQDFGLELNAVAGVADGCLFAPRMQGLAGMSYSVIPRRWGLWPKAAYSRVVPFPPPSQPPQLSDCSRNLNLTTPVCCCAAQK